MPVDPKLSSEVHPGMKSFFKGLCDQKIKMLIVIYNVGMSFLTWSQVATDLLH